MLRVMHESRILGQQVLSARRLLAPAMLPVHSNASGPFIAFRNKNNSSIFLRSRSTLRPVGNLAYFSSNTAPATTSLLDSSAVPPPPPPPPPLPLPWGRKRLRSAMQCLRDNSACQKRALFDECISVDLWPRVVASLHTELTKAARIDAAAIAALAHQEQTMAQALESEGHTTSTNLVTPSTVQLPLDLAAFERLCNDADRCTAELSHLRSIEAQANAEDSNRSASGSIGSAGDKICSAGGDVGDSDHLKLAVDKWGHGDVFLLGSDFFDLNRVEEAEGVLQAAGLKVAQETFVEAAAALTEAAKREATAKEAAAARVVSARQAAIAAAEAQEAKVAEALYHYAVAHALDSSDFRPAMDRLKMLRSISADMERPQEWYPAARLMKRKIIYHGGPTNSGKTYHALQALMHADPTKGGGVFCGPLRLLALEVYEQLNDAGNYCSLLTGQERKEIPFETHVSCTIEMVNVNRTFDVGVIDEIQMIGSPTRGYAWTRAFLGLQAREIHVCGSLEAETLVRNLCKTTGDEFELRTYDRMTPLKVADEPLKEYADVQPGDCVVAFSKQDIFRIREEIERLTPYKCCVVYGQLPPETRSKQAALFNTEGSGYDVLVASDAIGMGLNLNIRRVIFHTTQKIMDGPSKGKGPVEASMMKQIAGRAGRRSSQYRDQGVATCLNEGDMPWLRQSVASPVEQVKGAGLFPAVEHLQAFSDLLDKLDDEENNGSSSDGDSDGSSTTSMSNFSIRTSSNNNQRSGAVSAFDTTEPGWQFMENSEREWKQKPLQSSSAWWSADVTFFNHSASISGGSRSDRSSSSSSSNVKSPVVPSLSPLSLEEDEEEATSPANNNRKLSDVLSQFMTSARAVENGLFFTCRHDDIASLSNRLHGVTAPMAVTDAFTFCMAPVRANDQLSFSMLSQFADAWARGKPTALNIRFPPKPPKSVVELSDLCTKHNIVDLYLWLSNRFPGHFVERDMALRQKAFAIALIQESLATLKLDLEDIENLNIRYRGPGGPDGANSNNSSRKKGKDDIYALNRKGGKGKPNYSKLQRRPSPPSGNNSRSQKKGSAGSNKTAKPRKSAKSGHKKKQKIEVIK